MPVTARQGEIGPLGRLLSLYERPISRVHDSRYAAALLAFLKEPCRTADDVGGCASVADQFYEAGRSCGALMTVEVASALRGLTLRYSEFPAFLQKDDPSRLAERDALSALLDAVQLLLSRPAVLLDEVVRDLLWSPLVVLIRHAGIDAKSISTLLSRENAAFTRFSELRTMTAALDQALVRLDRAHLPWDTSSLLHRRPEMDEPLSAGFWRAALAADPETAVRNFDATARAVRTGLSFSEFAVSVADVGPSWSRDADARRLAEAGFFACIPASLRDLARVDAWASLWEEEVSARTAQCRTATEDLGAAAPEISLRQLQRVDSLVSESWHGLAAEVLSDAERGVADIQRSLADLRSRLQPALILADDASLAKQSPRSGFHERSVDRAFPRALPYITGAPLRPSARGLFVGRQDVFEFVQAHLVFTTAEPQRNILALAGLRRMGKTSVLQQIMGDRAGILAGRVPILVDFASLGAGALPILLWRLANKMFYSIPHKLRKISPPDETKFDRDHISGFADFLDRLEGAYSGVMMLWDEFQWVDQRVAAGVLDRDVYMIFRDILQTHEGVSVIIAGNMRLSSLHSGHDLSFYGSARVKRISFLDKESARGLVTNPVREWFDYTDEAVESIVHQTNGHPLLLQKFSTSVCELAIERNLRLIDGSLVEDASSRSIEDAEIVFRQIWNEELTDLQRDILGAMVRQEREPLEVTDAVRGLVEIELLTAGPSGWSVTIPAFQHWIARRTSRKV